MEIINILATFLISTILILISQKIFISKKYVDKITGRSSHKVIATRSGGSSLLQDQAVTTQNGRTMTFQYKYRM